MSNSIITYQTGLHATREQVVELYLANDWSSGKKPDGLMHHLENSHSVMTAWVDDRLIGLGNTLSDGRLVAYYSHLLVHPDWQGRGIGTEILSRLMRNYEGFHQQLLLADGKATEFYRKLGFVRAGETKAMWIFDGDEH
tara:strand:+ start:6147 stop:6563 length:417 start_codon:yes stop_codon:yes gene_type:complete